MGNTINYFGSARPNSGKTSEYLSGYYTYDYGANSNGYLPTDADRIILGDHEKEHTYQYQRLGPLFLPAYLLMGGVGSHNIFEQNADKVGNAAYLKWKYHEND